MNDHGRFDPAPVGRRLLARSGRLARVGGARFAARTIARHRNPTIGRRPRLMPVADPTPNDAEGYAPFEATPLPPTPPVAEPAPVALPRPGGISEEAARWLFRGERLVANMLPMSAIKPAPSVARRPSRGAIPRARIEEEAFLVRFVRGAPNRGGAEIRSCPGAVRWAGRRCRRRAGHRRGGGFRIHGVRCGICCSCVAGRW